MVSGVQRRAQLPERRGTRNNKSKWRGLRLIAVLMSRGYEVFASLSTRQAVFLVFTDRAIQLAQWNCPLANNCSYITLRSIMTGSIVLLMNVCFDSFLPTSYPVICCDCHCVYCEAPAVEAGVSSPIAQIWVTAVSSQLKVRRTPQRCCRPAAGRHSPCSETSLQTRHRLFCTSGPKLNLKHCWDAIAFVWSSF